MAKNEKKWHQLFYRYKSAKKIISRLTGTGSMVFILIFTTGCLDMQMRIGRQPNPELLENPLRPGQSTRAEVIRVLGPPDGKGQEMLPIEAEPRTLWSYYYEQGTLKDSRRIFLFVFFDQDLYDGYMWFSSLSD